jgi:hypothetical protein
MEVFHVRSEATAGVEGVESGVPSGPAVGDTVGSEVSVGGRVGVSVGAGVAVHGTKTTTVGACRSTVVRAVCSALTNPYTPSSIKSANTPAMGR